MKYMYKVIVICPFAISHSNIEFLKPIVLKLGIRRLVVSNCRNEGGKVESGFFPLYLIY